MNLNSFHIDGFGIFHDLEAQDFPDGLMLVRGDNEAGKSTCLAFIRAVLFGFPDKRMARKQYPPLRGGTHGGRLTFTSKEFGTVIVQRHPGTHGGAVTLTFDDGSTGGKRELNDLLAGMTADLFRNIYAFSLNELQTLDSLQDDSVGTALYAASSGAGLAALANAQNTVSNRLDELFKPGGRKPAINHLLGQLDQVRQKLRESTGTLSLYADTKLELKTLEHQLDETRKTLDQVSLHLRKVDSCLAAWEDWTTLQTAENDLKTLPLVVTSFPPDGLERFERLNDAHRRCMEERDNLRRQVNTLNEKIKASNVDDRFIEHQKTIRMVVESRTEFQRLRERLNESRNAVGQIDNRIGEKLQDLGDTWTPRRVMKTDFSLFTVNRLRSLATELTDTENKRDQSATRLAERKHDLREIRQEVQASEAHVDKLKAAVTAVDDTTLHRLRIGRDRMAHLVEALPQTRRESEQEKRRLATMLQEINPQWTTETLRHADTSLSIRHRIDTFKGSLAKAAQEKNEAELQLRQTEANEQAARERLDACKQQLKTEAGEDGADEDSLGNQKRDVRQLVRLITQHDALESATPRISPLPSRETPKVMTFVIRTGFALALCGTLAALGGAALQTPSLWIPAALLATVSAAAATAFAVSKSLTATGKTYEKPEISHLTQRIEELTKTLPLDASQPVTLETVGELEENIDNHLLTIRETKVRQGDLRTLQKELETATQANEQARASVLEYQTQYDAVNEQWADFRKSWGFDDNSLDPIAFSRIFDRIDEAKKKLDAIADLDHKITSMSQTVHDLRNLVKTSPLSKNTAPDDVQPADLIRHMDKHIETYNSQVGQLQTARSTLNEKTRLKQTIEAQLEEAEQQTGNAQREFEKASSNWQSFLEKQGLSPELNSNTALEALEALRECRNAIDRKQELHTDIQRLEEELQNIRETVTDTMDTLARQMPDDSQLAGELARLGEELDAMLQANVRRLELEERLRDTLTQLEGADERLDRLSKERTTLMKAAEADNEDTFRERFRYYTEREKLTNTAREVMTRIQSVVGSDDWESLRKTLKRTSHPELQTEKERLERERRKISKLFEEQQQHLGELTQAMKDMASDDDIASLRADEEALLTEIRRHAEEWSRYTLVDFLLKQARQEFEQEQQPKVIQDASRFFQSMTNGRYEKIIAPLGEEAIEVLSRQGRRKPPDALSRGTAEQLYLALRFGYVVNARGTNETIPLIMDDILVNFDPTRAANAARTIAALATDTKRQILFFTCHPATIQTFHAINPDIPVYTLTADSFERETS